MGDWRQETGISTDTPGMSDEINVSSDALTSSGLFRGISGISIAAAFHGPDGQIGVAKARAHAYNLPLAAHRSAPKLLFKSMVHGHWIEALCPKGHAVPPFFLVVKGTYVAEILSVNATPACA